MVEIRAQVPAYDLDAVKVLIESRVHLRGPLLEILHAIQDDLGWIDPRVTPLVADALNLSQAEVRGVISFYRDFLDTPPPSLTIRLCRGEACQSLGAQQLVANVCENLGIASGEVTPDGRVGLEEVFCLGNCALGPSAMIGGRLIGRVDASAIDALIADCETPR